MDALTYVSHWWRGLQRLLHKRLCVDSGILTRWDCAQFARMAFELGRYGVFACGHMMHLDCRVSYEAYERGCQAVLSVCMQLCVIR